MDGALEERFAPALTATPAIEAFLEIDIDSTVVNHNMEATTLHPEQSHTPAHDHATSAKIKESSISTPKEVSVVTHDKITSPSLSELEESLDCAFKDVSTGSHGSCPTHGVSKESLNCEVNEVSMVANGSSARSSTALKLEPTSNFATKDMPMVDSVTDNLVKVSIQHSVNSNGYHFGKLCDSINSEGIHSQSLEGCESMKAKERDATAGKFYPDDEPLQHNARTCSDDDDDGKSVMDEDEDEDEDEGVEQESEGEQESEDGDSSSSTSTLVFSSSSDDEEADHYRLPNNFSQDMIMEAESEAEEGELKESSSQRKKINVKKKAMGESSEDEGGLKEPVRSRNEAKDLPSVPKVSVTLQPYHTMAPAGFVSSVVGVSLIVEGIEGQQALSEGSILWLTDERSPLGIVDELFGPVKKPFYVVRYNDASELPEGAKEGAQVSYVRDFADFVLNLSDLYAKACDNSGDHDEELSDSEVYFSDDEKEAEYRCSKSRTKRGNSELRTPDIDTRQHQERRTQGKRSSKENRNQRSRGDNARNFPSNNDFSGRPPRHDNPPFHRRQGERDPSFLPRRGERDSPYQRRQGEREWVEHMQTSHERFGGGSPARQVRSQQSLGVDQSNSSTPPRRAVSVSHEVGTGPQPQAQVSKTNQVQASPRPMSQEVQPTQSNQSSQSTSWELQPPQTNQSRSCMQPTSPQQMSGLSEFMQPTQIHQSHSVMQTLQQGQTNTPHTIMQSTAQLTQVNHPHSYMQQVVPSQPQHPLQQLTPLQGHMISQSPPALPQPQAWHMNQPIISPNIMASPQLPGVQHSQVPLCNAAVVVGQVPQVAVSGYGIPPTNNAPLQSGMGSGQRVFPMHQSPVFEQVPSQKQFSSIGAHQFSAQASPTMGMQMGSQVQAAHVDGYPMGVQPVAFAAPVLGIPVVSASAPSNFMVHNQQYSGVTPGCAPAYGNGPPVSYGNGPPPTYGVPDHPRPMHPMQPSPGTSSGSWQQQSSPQGSTWQQPYQQRTHHGRPPHRSPRF